MKGEMKMKRWTMFAAAGAAAVLLAGCKGETKTPQEPVTEETQETEETQQPEETLEKEEDSQESAKEPEGSAGEQAEGEAEDQKLYEDNFAVDNEAVVAYAQKIKEAVAAADLEALADLTGFPVYVGFPEEGLVVETREDFIALGGDRVFTQDLMDSVAAADENALSPSMAGFSLSDGVGKANVNFGVQDGKLAINGINY